MKESLSNTRKRRVTPSWWTKDIKADDLQPGHPLPRMFVARVFTLTLSFDLSSFPGQRLTVSIRRKAVTCFQCLLHFHPQHRSGSAHHGHRPLFLNERRQNNHDRDHKKKHIFYNHKRSCKLAERV